MERDGPAPAAREHTQHTKSAQGTEHRQQVTRKAPAQMPPTSENEVDLDRLLADIGYQFAIRDAFGENGLARLLKKARDNSK